MDYSKTFNDLILEAWERFSDGEPDNKLELRASEFIDKVRETVLDDINSKDRILEILKNQLLSKYDVYGNPGAIHVSYGDITYIVYSWNGYDGRTTLEINSGGWTSASDIRDTADFCEEIENDLFDGGECSDLLCKYFSAKK